jgi:hypothetical protein
VNDVYARRLHLVKRLEVEEVQIIGYLFFFRQLVPDRPLCLSFHEHEQVLGQLELKAVARPFFEERLGIGLQSVAQDSLRTVRIFGNKFIRL